MRNCVVDGACNTARTCSAKALGQITRLENCKDAPVARGIDYEDVSFRVANAQILKKSDDFRIQADEIDGKYIKPQLP